MRAFPVCLLFSATLACADEVRLNQIQAIGSHNSYHVAAPRELLDTVVKFNKDAKAWDYTHPPLTEQLDMGVRQFELDIFADSKGGLFSKPSMLNVAKMAGAKNLTFDPDGKLAKPGFKVLHIPDIDCWSNAPVLKDALAEMKAWSDQHPQHLPIMILLECKDQPQPPLPTKPEELTRERLLELEKEVLSAIPADRVLEPDEVRGKENTLREAVTKHGWPDLDSLRGKFIFCLDNTNEVRSRYLEGNPALEGRLIFASAPDTRHPAAAWFKCNDPEKQLQEIKDLVKAGFLVRTRSDTNKPDDKMKAAAFESGAQWVSTDHFRPDDKDRVSFDGKPVRPNPVSGNPGMKIEP
ncbi:Ca2+-dependent phosphoinositide-specific phospholipase C [Luteolibacter luteus]|uniref:Glycerophosphodiester phosphodiesterase n=1 Tax=Luteolibacter luteus TaxID=2728835 RepID=A0A858RQI0_9BACT|nr:Ca2+-dependent phosphoinositide-specific phospholipase C [Luteolibacter luteus]QJE98380.1 hypothetical protein HHL09_22195 [Luteolibacter luteus]